MTEEPRYDTLGHGYALQRREDPVLRAQIARALQGCGSVVNVGAGPGSYEPAELQVLAIEPSAVMAAQRPPHRPIAIRATADSLPLHDDSVDAAMTVLSLHHWGDAQRAGVIEMRRVATGPVVIVTCDPRVTGRMWLLRDYLPEVAALDLEIFPLPETVMDWLGEGCEMTVLPTSADTPDHSLFAFWAHPEWVADPDARNATSGFSRQHPAVVQRVVRAVAADLASGRWDQRHGHLRDRSSLDVGLRMIVHRPGDERLG